MKFRTNIAPTKTRFSLTHEQPVMLMGSCFAENIGEKLDSYKFNKQVNPFGILYNPASIANALIALLENEKYTEEDLLFQNGLWHHYNFHGKFSHVDKAVCLEQVNAAVQNGHDFLLSTDTLFITFGTAWTFILKDTEEVVANCHKVPAKNFDRELLKLEEIVQMYTVLIKQLLRVNPKMNIVFTVSPVRHWKDGAIDNHLSKSILTVAVHQLVEQFIPVQYFEAYELMLDDLRDYRFYAEDMLHPSVQAIDYIWNHFSETYFFEDTQHLNKRIEKVQKGLNHRFLFPDSEEAKEFKAKVAAEVELLKRDYPHLKI